MEVDPTMLKAKNDIVLWSGAIDVRERHEKCLQPERDCVLFHYTNKQAVEAEKHVNDRGGVFLFVSLWFYFEMLFVKEQI